MICRAKHKLLFFDSPNYAGIAVRKASWEVIQIGRLMEAARGQCQCEILMCLTQNKQTLVTARHRRSRAGTSSLRNTVKLIVFDWQDVEKAPDVSELTLGALNDLSIKPRFGRRLTRPWHCWFPALKYLDNIGGRMLNRRRCPQVSESRLSLVNYWMASVVQN